MIRTHIARTVSEIEGIRSLWLELERAPGITLYQSFRWNHAIAATLNTAEPFVVAVETNNGAAIIPAAVEGGALTLLGDALFDYRDVLSNDDDALAAAWRVLADRRLPLRFTALREDTPHSFWTAAGRVDFCNAPSMSLDDISAEEFARRHWRQAKQFRRLLREGVRLVHSDGSNAGLVRWIYEQKAGQLAGDPNNVFADRRRIDFMVRIAAEEGSRCDVYCLQAGGAVISSLIAVRDDVLGCRPVRRYYTTVFDHAWARLSPGIALLYEVARQSLAEGMDVDLQTGEQFHKSRLATRSTPLYRIELAADQLAALVDAPASVTRVAA